MIINKSVGISHGKEKEKQYESGNVCDKQGGDEKQNKTHKKFTIRKDSVSENFT